MTDPGTAKTEVLLEALPYMQQFRGLTFLIKVGGSAMEDEELLRSLLRDVVFLEAVGINPVIVHGGGKAISQAMERKNLEPQWVSGLRVTDREAVRVVEETLGRVINPALVEMLRGLGGRATGVPGKSVFQASRMSAQGADGQVVSLGFVGQVEEVDPGLVDAVVQGEQVPVVTPLGNEPETGATLNVNADLAASALACEMRVTKLIYLSDVRGVLRNASQEESLIPSIAQGEIEGLIEKKVIQGGMIPKVRSASQALDAGVKKVHLIDGRIKHALLLEVFTDLGIGTEIVR
ncbi:MAG: acetylglutamate kinase [Verrucomicrobiota bacterium]